MSIDPRTGAAYDERPQDKLPRLVGLLGDVRVAGVDLLNVIATLQSKLQLTDADARLTEYTSTLAELAQPVDETCAEIQKRLDDAACLLNADGRLYGDYGGQIAQIRQAWRRSGLQQGAAVLGAGAPLTADELAQIAQLLADMTIALRSLVYYCEQLALPQVVKTDLKALRVGKSLDFNTRFKSEVPDAGQRAELLVYLDQHSRDLPGVVDVQTGRILRISRAWWANWISPLVTLLLVLLGAATPFLMAYLATTLPDNTWPFPSNAAIPLLNLYVFVLAGGVAHVLIDALKQARSGAASVLALNDWLQWLQVNALSVWAGILSLWIGFLIVAFNAYSQPEPRTDWQSAFFVGYSIDSVMELFLQRFGQFASGRTQATTSLVQQTVPI
jgi:hypothetical protein